MTQNQTEKPSMTWDDIADYIVGKGKTEVLGTGAMVIGTGLVTKGIITGDGGDILEGSIIGGAGLLARAGRIVYRVVKNRKPAEQPKAPDITPEQAEDALKFVENASTSNATAEVLKKAAAQLGLDDVRWIQLQAKAQRGAGHMNKPEAQLYNAVIRHAELACAQS